MLSHGRARNVSYPLPRGWSREITTAVDAEPPSGHAAVSAAAVYPGTNVGM